MGILDDAIREHLDLKRRLGAADDELKQLEDEAFGPPARPGEPDFPTSEAPVVEDSGHADGPDEPIEEPPTAQVPAEAPSEELEAAQEPVAVEEEPPRAEEDEPGGEAPTEMFDQPIEQELDLDLDLEDEELPELDEHVPVESLETVEHPMATELSQPDDEPDLEDEELEARAAEAPPSVEPRTGEEEELGEEEADEDDDVLADTPEFLRDAPEDDELWFEQGEPKDFDFD